MTLHKPTTPDLAGLKNIKRAAWFAECWERLWPLILPLVAIVCIFASLSWLGLWPAVSDQIRRLILGLFAVAAGLAFIPIGRFRFPTSAQIDHRVEQASNLSHQPIGAQGDKPAASGPASLGNDDNPVANAMWQEHQRRMAGSLNNLKSGKPVPKIAQHDPFALRALVGLLLFIGVAAGWGNWSARISDAFRSHTPLDSPTGRIDAWVTPPAYTNRPPVFLSRSDSDHNTVSNDQAKTIVPEGSTLLVRVLDVANPRLDVIVGDQTQTVSAQSSLSTDGSKDDASQATAEQATKKPNKGQTFTIALQDSASARLQSNGKTIAQWSFTIVPDENPVIEFVEKPKPSNRGALEFSYKAVDDYGIQSIKAEVDTTRADDKNAVPLIAAPKLKLPLPARSSKNAAVKTSQDLTAHPWAGSEVNMTLLAQDQAEQIGRSQTVTITLPERMFTKPLAKAVIEERRNLALNVHAAAKVADMLDIITTTHPEMFIKDKSVFTALRVSYRMIKRAQSNDQLIEAVDLLWETALAIEDGDLSRAERRLRDAQERLSKALENGASDKEIDALMKELREAMNEFLAELQQHMNNDQQAMPMAPNTQALRQQDIDRMMKQIEDLAKSGSKDAARQLLQELQRMMNNLQTARPNQQQQRQTDEFSKQMDKLGDMMRQQQQLMDQTFKMQRRQQQQRQGGQQGQQKQKGQQQKEQQQGQGSQPQGQKPMTAEEFAKAMKELKKQQGALKNQMDELQKSLKDLGMEPGKLGEAGKSMGKAEGELGQGKPGEATGDQGRALQAMREGAQQMMQNMQNQAGEQGRRGERGQHGQQTRQDQDPLGRKSQSNAPQLGQDTKVPDEIDAQRAREILEAIRRRLGEQTRPKLELDYLDRLLPTR